VFGTKKGCSALRVRTKRAHQISFAKPFSIEKGRGGKKALGTEKERKKPKPSPINGYIWERKGRGCPVPITSEKRDQ